MSAIRVKNIYYMLAYAFHALREKEFRHLGAEEFEHIDDLFAAILTLGISGQIKRGLCREYLQKTESLTTLRGKIDMAESLKTASFVNRRLICRYDEFSEDNVMNRILKTTAVCLIKSENVTKENRRKLRKRLAYFENVQQLDRFRIPWHALHFHQNNATYRMLIGICRLVLERQLLTEETGSTALKSYGDDMKMYHLYEKFVLKFFQKHYPPFHAAAVQIPWNLDDDYSEYLPTMLTDIMLSFGDKTLIIDTKWYTHTMSRDSRWSSRTYHSTNLYQIFAYVKNLDRERTGNVSGLLLYAKTDAEDTPDSEYRIDGNRIAVKTLDLGGEWETIECQLRRIAEFLIGREDFHRPTSNGEN